MAEIKNDKWISIDDAAEYLGVKPGTIRDWIRKGKDIPAHKIGKQWKFKCIALNPVILNNCNPKLHTGSPPLTLSYATIILCFLQADNCGFINKFSALSGSTAF